MSYSFVTRRQKRHNSDYDSNDSIDSGSSSEKNDQDLQISQQDSSQIFKEIEKRTRDFSNFDIVFHHHRLEILESRINQDFDKEHGHPGVVPLIEQCVSHFEFTPDEKNRLDEYKLIHPKQKIPNFWEPRPWDCPESKLTDEQSKELAENIQKESDIDPDDPNFLTNINFACFKKDYDKKNAPNGRKFLCSLPTVDFITDNSSENTDIEYLSMNDL